MKKLTAITVLLSCTVWAPSAAAQSFGLNGGLNLSDIFGGGVESAQTRTGLNAGGTATLLSLGPVSVGAEIYYAQKGAAETMIAAESPDFYQQFGLNYIEVPVVARVAIPISTWLRGYLQGGPAFAWNLDCNLEPGADQIGSLSDGCDLDQFGDGRTAIRSSDQGLVMGGGLRLNVLGRGSVNIDSRMVRGLARLSEGTAEPEIRNRAFSVMLGYSAGW